MKKVVETVDPTIRVPREVTLELICDRLTARSRTYDREFLQAAHDLSTEKHDGQVRKSGEPYIVHPRAVAYILADLGFDQVCIAVGMLHDLVEDTLTTREVLAERFGPGVATLVEGMTKISRHAYHGRDDAQAQTFRKLILASAKDVRVLFVKLADRLHNMLTLEHLSAARRRRIAEETLDIYAPIANRLGMSRVKEDLEDLAFYHLEPERFVALKRGIEKGLKAHKGLRSRFQDALVQALEAAAIEADISFRMKRYYSVYCKLKRRGIDVAGMESGEVLRSHLQDYLAFRIITEQVVDCYAALGVVHNQERRQGQKTTWRPVLGRLKDYIATPKPNGYQSLHTTVLMDGMPVEVQIRTQEMDSVAENGIAAHWVYKEGQLDQEEIDHFNWLRQVLEWQGDVQNPRSFMSTLKVDLYQDEVYVGTPKGDVLSFPKGATPLDFAYKIHTELGHHCSGARVNGKLVPLKTELAHGDVVEILTHPSRNPSRDWLSFVKTPRARAKIRHWLNHQQKKEATEIGRRLVEKKLRKYKVSPRRLWESPRLERYLTEEGIGGVDDLLSRIGFGKLSVQQVLDRVLESEELEKGPSEAGALQKAVRKILPFGESPIRVKGQDGLMTYLAKCCSPLPGDEVVGYVTRGRGVSVHRADCPNFKRLLVHPEREIEVAWAHDADDVFAVALEIRSEDHPGILARVSEVAARLGSNIRQCDADTDAGGGRIAMVLEVRDHRHLRKLLQAIRAVKGVLEVDRLMAADGRQHVVR